MLHLPPNGIGNRAVIVTDVDHIRPAFASVLPRPDVHCRYSQERAFTYPNARVTHKAPCAHEHP